MKNDIVLYEKIYRRLKYQIECGLLPHGYKLPSRADMCKEYETSEKPVRCAIEMLVRDGLIKASPRRRPVVIYHPDDAHRTARHALQKAASTSASNVIKTGILVCYPVINRGISLCKGEDWSIPETIIEHMDPKQITAFWRLSNSFWRFFVARNGNELILRIIDRMGYSEIDTLVGNYDIRAGYLATLEEFLRTVKAGGSPKDVPFDDMSFVYGFSGDKNENAPDFILPADSVFLLEGNQFKQKVCKSEERYSRIYLDILGQISMGRYNCGDYLPSHKELQDIYGVSIDTTLRAIKVLKEWGVVKATPHKGIEVIAELDELKKIHIDPKLVACHVRRFLDSLELLTLTVEGVTAHAMSDIEKEDIEQFRNELEKRWNDSYMFHYFPSYLLKFITEHIKYKTLRSIYDILRKNFHIGRSIPKLIGREKAASDYENYTKCLTAVELLENGNTPSFAELTAKLFQNIQSQIIEACKKMDYWNAAMAVYDKTSLWK